MKTRLLLLTSLMGLQLAVHAQKYQMEVETKGGRIVSYLVNDLQDVVCKDTTTTITLSNKETIVYHNDNLVSISWTEYKGSQTAESSTFNLDESHNAIVTPEYSVKFLAGSIASETNITVKKVNDAPSILDSGVDEMVVYDFTLDKPANFEGVAVIRLPMKAEEGDMVFGSYYDPELKDWEGVVNYYDEEKGEVVITTNHFSRFGIFRISKEKSIHAKLQLLEKNKLVQCIAMPTIGLAATAMRLREFTFSDNPDAAAMDAFSNKYSEVSQIGLDIGYNALKALGLESDLLEGFSGVLGHVGTALSVYQICRNDFRGEDAEKAGNTLKFALNQCVGKLSSACGSMAMYACLASVAIMDYSLNKFATAAQSGRKDMYIRTYNDWMEEHPRHNGDWATLFKPYFRVFSRYTRDEIHELIDEDVMEYCNAPWKDDWCAFHFYQATGKSWTYSGGQTQALCDELANNKRNELYNGDIPEAVERLKGELLSEMYPKMKARLDEYAYELNRGFNLLLVDSSLIESGAKESAFAGYTVRFKDHADQEMEGLEWDTVLDEKGSGVICNRVGFLAYFNQKAILEVVSPDEKVVKIIHLKNLKAGYTGKDGSNEDVDNYINIAPPQIVAVVANGNLFCSSPTYRDGEIVEMGPLAMSIAMEPGAIETRYDGDMIHVRCKELIDDGEENVAVGPRTVITFSIMNADLIDQNDATIKNLFIDGYFSFTFGEEDNFYFEEFSKINVSSELPMLPQTITPDADYGGDDDFDDDDLDDDDYDDDDYEDDDDLYDLLINSLGAKYGKVWQQTQPGGLKISNCEITRKDYDYKWDKELEKQVVDHIDTHVFTLDQNNPGNSVQVTILFR